MKFAVFRSNPRRQVIVLLEICCKDTNIHEIVENKISDFWLHKAQNVRACNITSHPGPLALETSKLTTEIPDYHTLFPV